MWAFDEGRFGLKTWCRKRWCPLGVRPPWIVQDEYQWLWVYVAVEPSSGRCHVLLLPGVNGAWFAAYLQSLRQAIGNEAVTLLLDNAPSHHSHAVAWPEGITPLYLPPYSPECNPAEQVFRLLRAWLSNHVFATLDALQTALISALQRFWDDPQVLISLTHYPWWQAAPDTFLSPSP